MSITLKDWVKNVDWLITSNLLPVNVRVDKNVACLIKLANINEHCSEAKSELTNVL
jgi:hypothetical protein